MNCFAFVLCVAVAASPAPTVEIAKGVSMPKINLGTCCGSDPSVGLPAWIAAGGVGIDTAFDYDDQAKIAKVLQGGVKRSSVFITTKIPAGIGAMQGNSSDCAADPDISFNYVMTNLKQLGVDYVDLVLLHGPCQLAKNPVPDADASNNALWKGLEKALKNNLTRAIGVSNYNAQNLQSLKGTVPAVDQCQLSVNGSFGQPPHDDVTISYCENNGITYESYGDLKGCPMSDSKITAIATAHGKSAAQVCLRWAIQRGAVIASGTGADATTAAKYAKENLDIFDDAFVLTDAEMDVLNKFGSR
jgi:diketogulonate reductase-like aldo/keto reductase